MNLIPLSIRASCWPVLLAGCLILLQPRRAQADDALEAAVDAVVEKHGFSADKPGLAILVVQPGKLRFEKGYGLAHLENRTPITPQTLFELASVSKSFTATAILILQDAGKLSVEDDVRKYIPELPEYKPKHPIRIRDLLRHVSGLPDYMDFENVPARHKGYWVNEDYAGQFARRRKEFPLSFSPGEKYEYNNTNYMLLGLIVARVSKKSYGAFMHDAIFAPTGMQNTFVYESPQAVPKKHPPGCVPAIGYERQKKEWKAAWGTPPLRQEELLTVGDGAIWSNLEDMAHWDEALRADKLLKPESMKQARASSKLGDGEQNDYGFGWSLYWDDSGKLTGYGHEGAWGGFNTSYYQYVAADRTTVLLSNRGNFDPDKFWYALDAVIEEHLSGGE